MGDARFDPYHARVQEASDRAAEIRALTDEGVICALAAASQRKDPYLANVLATEALNRVSEKNAIICAAGEGLCALDREGRLTFMNPAAERMLGWTLAQLRGRNAYEALHGLRDEGEAQASPRGCCAACSENYCERDTRDQDDVLTRKDGSPLSVLYTSAPILRDGEVEGAVVVFRDVTERKRAEEALRESQARYKALAAASAQIVWSSKPGGRLDDLPDWHAYTGQSPEESQGQGWLTPIHPEDRERVLHAWTHACETGTIFDIEYRLRRADGEYRRFAVRGVPVLGENGQVREWVGTFNDIAERKRTRKDTRPPPPR